MSRKTSLAMISLILSVLLILPLVISNDLGFTLRNDTLWLFNNKDAVYIFQNFAGNFSKVTYEIGARAEGSAIIIPDSGASNAEEFLEQNQNSSIISQEVNGNVIPYIKLPNGKFVGRNFNIDSGGEYIVWAKENTKLRLSFEIG